jgi:hypothetical protein
MVKAPRYPFFAISLGIACLSSGALLIRSAPIMHEARQFLTLAHKNLADGALDSAEAYAGAVLIADEVSINVNVDSVPMSQRDACKRALDETITTWVAALDNSIRFRIETDPAKADIKLKFIPDVRFLKDPVAGLTTWKRTIRSSNGKVTGISPKTDVLVRTQDPRFRPMSESAMRQAIEHEFGHVLGLEDSEHMGDIMGQLDLDHPVAGPRDYEIFAVKSLRDEARQVKLDAENKKESTNQPMPNGSGTQQ